MNDEEKLLRVLKQEEQDSTSYYSSELAEKQAEALKRYYAEPYGDELPDRSKVVTHDIADHVDWIMPDLLRVFVGSDDIIDVEAPRPDQEDLEREIQEAVQHVFFKDNDGQKILHDFIFDGLVQRVGVIDVEWAEPEKGPPRMWKGVLPDRLLELVDDPEYEILEQEEYLEQTELGPVPAFNLRVQKTPKMGKCKVEVVPPEEFRISKRAKSFKEADYLARQTPAYLGDIAKQFPKSVNSLLDGGAMYGSTGSTDGEEDERVDARFPDEADTDEVRNLSNEEERRKVTLIKEFIRYDFDGDGYVEWRQIKRVENTVLENIMVDGPTLTGWSPIPVSHKAIGRSMADRLGEVQRVRTVLSRAFMDNVALSTQPRVFANEMALGEGGMDMLLDHVIGSVVPTKANPRDVVLHETVPDMTGSAYQALEYWDQQAEIRTGVSRHSQGLDPNALNKTATGIDLLQSASSGRKEFYARQVANALEHVFDMIVKCLSSYQDHPRQIRISGDIISFDPRRWVEDCAIRVHVGQGIASRERRLLNLTMLAQKQEQLIAVPGNPLCGMKEYSATLMSMVEEMGYKDTTRFFREIPEEYEEPPAPPPEDPNVIKAKADSELKAQKQAADLQVEQETMIAEQARKDRELEAEIERKRWQTAEELRLKAEQVSAELALAKEKAAHVNTSDIRPGGDPG